MGIANKHRELSATANVAINMLRAVHIPEIQKIVNIASKAQQLYERSVKTQKTY